jgi:alanine dehydrogenase
MALLLKANELVGLISLEEAIEAVRLGYRDQGEAPAYSAPRSRMQHEDRRVTVHSGGCCNLEVAGTFIHVERFTFHGGAQQYAGAGKRVYVVYDSETAALRTIIVGSLPLFDFEPEEDWYGTETPITSAVGTNLLARPDSRILGLYGTGRQARRHLITHCTTHPIEEVRVYSRSEENRAAFIRQMQPLTNARLKAVDAPEAVAEGADIICCATGSNVPVLKGEWLEPGQHVTSIVNSNKGVKEQAGLKARRRELDDDVVARADVILTVLTEQAIIDEHGDLFEPVERGLVSWDDMCQLSEILTGQAEGRTSDDQITLFKQNSDQGVGYMALGKLAHDKAVEAGIGMEI